MKICLGKELVDKVKKKDSENEKNLLKNRNSDELDADDIYFHSNTIKNIKLGSNVVNRIYLNNSIVYELQDTIIATKFHALVPSATATSIIFDSLENQNISNYNLVGYCDENSHIAVYQYNTEYLILNIRNAVNYAPFSCYNFFYNYKVLINCVLYNFNTNNVTNMSSMFNYCSSLTSLDLSSFNTQNVTNMNSMFYHCSSLTSLDLSSFNTQNVTNMGLMFSSCLNITSLDVSNFDTSKVTVLAFMFDLCFNLTSLDVSNFDTSNAISMNSMFGRNENLASLDLRNFNTAKVTTINYMFYQCYKLDTIFSKTFILRSGLTSDYMFYQCNSLVGSNGTLYSSSHINAEYARVDGENGLPGYFTAPANK